VKGAQVAKDCADAVGVYIYDLTWSADRFEVTLSASSDLTEPEGPDSIKLEQFTVKLKEALEASEDGQDILET
jgi:hypothetical protein